MKCIFNSLVSFFKLFKTNIVKIVIRFPEKIFVKILKHTLKCFKRLFDYRNSTTYPIVKEIPLQISDDIVIKLCSEDNKLSEMLDNFIQDLTNEKKKIPSEPRKLESLPTVYVPPLNW